MTALDFIIILVFGTALIRGARRGFIQQFCSAVGFVGGLLIGGWLQTKLIHFASTPTAELLWSVVIVLGSGLFLLAVGEFVGRKLQSQIPEFAGSIDRLLGMAAAGAMILVVLWFTSGALFQLPAWRQFAERSPILNLVHNSLPTPPNLVAQLNQILGQNSFPKVFANQEPSLAEEKITLPDLNSLSPAIQKTAPSVVKISGKGCGGIIEGSGFVADEGLAVTNAHVVAGVERPTIIDTNGTHETVVVWFDPNIDFAVLKTSEDLAGNPLPLNTQIASSGSGAVALGYPGGGPFQASPAAIIDVFTANGLNIYEQGLVARQVYSAKVDVISGNSGGPLVDESGSVIGVIFAESTEYEDVGYALTLQEVIDELEAAKKATTPVDTGPCT